MSINKKSKNVFDHKELDYFFQTRIFYYDVITGDAHLYDKKEMTPEDWINYGKDQIDEDLNTYPNAKAAKDIMNSPLYKALKEDKIKNGNNDVGEEE